MDETNMFEMCCWQIARDHDLQYSSFEDLKNCFSKELLEESSNKYLQSKLSSLLSALEKEFKNYWHIDPLRPDPHVQSYLDGLNKAISLVKQTMSKT